MDESKIDIDRAMFAAIAGEEFGQPGITIRAYMAIEFMSAIISASPGAVDPDHCASQAIDCI